MIVCKEYSRMGANEMVTISKKEYDALQAAADELWALHAGGVDNWEGYHDSLRDAGLLDNEDDDE